MLTREDIGNTLAEMQAAKGVRVLLAVESGSRCWGFASPDSDYDVRFVYARPLEEYLRLGEHRDTIEWRLDDEYDVSGWDISKFLRLMRGSNPSVYEWLGSPIVYAEALEFLSVRELAPACFNPVASVHHYFGMATNNWRDLGGEAVKLKKYLYVMRAILAARWAIAQRTPVPMAFSELREACLEPEMQSVVDAVLAEKAAGDEKAPHARIAEFDEWIERGLADIASRIASVEPVRKPDWGPIDEVFRAIAMSGSARANGLE